MHSLENAKKNRFYFFASSVFVGQNKNRTCSTLTRWRSEKSSRVDFLKQTEIKRFSLFFILAVWKMSKRRIETNVFMQG